MITENSLFSRSIKTWGSEKQQALSAAGILIAGVGGLGSIVSEMLVRSGIGRIIVVDDGVVDEPDLNRQTLYTAGDIGQPKVQAASKRLSSIHNHTEIITINARIDRETVQSELFNQYEFNGIADCLDNFESRFALEELLDSHSFLVHGGVQNDYGQITTIKRNETLQLKKLYNNSQKTEAVLPVCPQIVSCAGSMMAYEILNNLWNTPQLLNTLLVMELSDFSLFKIKLDQGV